MSSTPSPLPSSIAAAGASGRSLRLVPTAPGRRLRLVPATSEAARPHRWFCSGCAASPPGGRPPEPFARGCACGAGVYVEAAADVAPAPGDAFLIVDRALTVLAASAAAADALAVAPRATVGRPLTDLLVAAETTADAAPLANATIAAGRGEVRRLTARPTATDGVHLRLRVGVCGPPRAAVIVVERRACADAP